MLASRYIAIHTFVIYRRLINRAPHSTATEARNITRAEIRAELCVMYVVSRSRSDTVCDMCTMCVVCVSDVHLCRQIAQRTDARELI